MELKKQVRQMILVMLAGQGRVQLRRNGLVPTCSTSCSSKCSSESSRTFDENIFMSCTYRLFDLLHGLDQTCGHSKISVSRARFQVGTGRPWIFGAPAGDLKERQISARSGGLENNWTKSLNLKGRALTATFTSRCGRGSGCCSDTVAELE
eukprot:3255500-Amphidinium_carterae.1